MKPTQIKMLRALEDGNRDIGAMVDDLEMPATPPPEYGMDLTDVTADSAPPPVPEAPTMPTLPEYDSTPDLKAIAQGAAADRQDDIARTLFGGGRQFAADLLGQRPTQTSIAPGTAKAEAMTAADKRKADAKQRRLESLRVLEMGAKYAPKPPPPVDAEKRQLERDEAERRRLETESRIDYRDKMAKRPPRSPPAPKGAKPDTSREGLPYGYSLRPGAQPTRKQRESAAEIVEQSAAMEPLIAELEVISKDRTAFANPSVRKRMAQLREQLGSKIRVMENLGVPSGKDAEIQLNIIGDPTSPTNNVLDVMPSLIRGLRSYSSGNVKARLDTLGIRRADDVVEDRVTVTNGEETLEIDADKLDDAKADGFRLVSP